MSLSVFVKTTDRYFFFFQAEDGIRDPLVTGVQTCALPISGAAPVPGRRLGNHPAGPGVAPAQNFGGRASAKKGATPSKISWARRTSAGVKSGPASAGVSPLRLIWA